MDTVVPFLCGTACVEVAAKARLPLRLRPLVSDCGNGGKPGRLVRLKVLFQPRL